MVVLSASRAHEYEINGMPCKFFVPYADMFNHKVEGCKTKCGYKDKSGFFMTATEDIEIGEEVCMNYGKLNMREWFFNYGFLDQNCHGNEVQIILNIDPNDPLFELKKGLIPDKW